MKIELEVISRETIKPSSPTPDHLRNYKLSFLDQISPPVYMPLVLFYETNPRNDSDFTTNIESKLNQLKNSLAKALTFFYPLAGRVVKDKAYIDCNDEGIQFIEARVSCQLSDVLENPNLDEFNKFLPYQLDNDDDVDDDDVDDVENLLFGVQVNVFQCGGMAIGLCFSHRVADALSFLMFVKSWATISRVGEDIENSNIVSPQFDSCELFPSRDLSGFRSNTGIVKDNNLVTKKFVFSTSSIVSLREKYSTQDLKPPTRVETLSAFIWNRFVASTQTDDTNSKLVRKIHTITHAVNIRKRMDPPLPDCSFGNLYRISITIPFIGEEKGECGDLVYQIRDSIKKIDGDYIAKLRHGDEHLNFIKDRAKKFIQGEVVSFSFTSLCGFPLYNENDFGWGKPAWIGSARKPFKNLVSLIDTKSGDGVEAWIILKEDDMAKLEGDDEFISFASPTTLPKI